MRNTIVAAAFVASFIARDAHADTVTIHDQGELTGGIVTATIGGMSLLGGSALLVTAALFSGCRICGDASAYLEAGAPLAITGAIALGIGVYVASIGGRHEIPRVAIVPELTPRSGGLGFVARF